MITILYLTASRIFSMRLFFVTPALLGFVAIAGPIVTARQDLSDLDVRDHAIKVWFTANKQ